MKTKKLKDSNGVPTGFERRIIGEGDEPQRILHEHYNAQEVQEWIESLTTLEDDIDRFNLEMIVTVDEEGRSIYIVDGVTHFTIESALGIEEGDLALLDDPGAWDRDDVVNEGLAEDFTGVNANEVNETRNTEWPADIADAAREVDEVVISDIALFSEVIGEQDGFKDGLVPIVVEAPKKDEPSPGEVIYIEGDEAFGHSDRMAGRVIKGLKGVFG